MSNQRMSEFHPLNIAKAVGSLLMIVFILKTCGSIGRGTGVDASNASNGTWYGQGIAVREMWACRTSEAYDLSMQRMSEGRNREAAAVPGCRSFYPGLKAWVRPGGFLDGLTERTRFEISDDVGHTFEYVTGKDAFRPE